VESLTHDNILVLPMGGLGNQLFIYGVGRALSSFRSCDLIVDTSFLSSQDWQRQVGLTPRQFYLDNFRLPSNVLTADFGTRFSRLAGFPFLHKRLFKAPAHKGDKRSWFVEREHKVYDPQVFDLPDGTSLFGYFQSWRYLEPIADELRLEISALKNPSVWYRANSDSWNSPAEVIGVHVRRGDYTDIVAQDYYGNALELARQILPDGQIRVFSDDIEAGLEVIRKTRNKALPVLPPKDTSDLESMMLLSQSRIIITANSTFSWWAGWLGMRNSPTVIAPRPWHEHEKQNFVDFLPPSWVTVGR